MKDQITSISKKSEINLRLSGKPSKKSRTTGAFDMVVQAEDGHCFLTNDRNSVHEQHLGRNIISEYHILNWQNIIQNRSIFLRNDGIDYVFLLGPDKQSVLWESLRIPQADHRNTMLIFSSIKDVFWFDPVAQLRDAAKTGIVISETDTHWDYRGAYIAYRMVADQHLDGQDLIEEGKDFIYISRDSPGDLGSKLTPPRNSSSNILKWKRECAKVAYCNGVTRNGSVKIFFNHAKKDVGVLVGDSYSQKLSVFFAEHFRILVWLRGSHDLNLIRSLGPKLVVGELGERFFNESPVSNDQSPVEMFFIRRLTRGEITGDEYKRLKMESSLEDIPGALGGLIARNDALGDMLVSNEPTERQKRFMNRIFEGAGAGDVLVAKYLAWARGTPCDPSWDNAFSLLARDVQDEFLRLCPM